ncbi:hypothetical protein BJV74DRAFT_773887 [Russula compacta]|nr:hypothetical protein BJV74DRAFT_773887 [Russula compacta]
MATGLAAALITLHYEPYLLKTPQHTSVLTGHPWVQELLAGHPRRFHNMMAMSRHVLLKLLRELSTFSGLQDTQHVTSQEQLAIFLWICRTGGSHMLCRG